MHPLPYLAGYPPEITDRAQTMLDEGRLEPWLAERYPGRHAVRSNKALYSYVQELKARFLKNAPPLGKVLFDDRLQRLHHALGLHVTSARVHGARTRTQREVRVAGLFKDAPPEFLRMIVVHELAHTKHAEHDRDFYRLCVHMEPDYHQLELDLRLHLTVLDAGR